MGLWDEWGIFWTFSIGGGYSESRRYNKGRATIIKKNKYFLLWATEEVAATIIVGGTFLSCQPLTQCATRTAPIMGLCFCLTAKIFFLLKA